MIAYDNMHYILALLTAWIVRITIKQGSFEARKIRRQWIEPNYKAEY